MSRPRVVLPHLRGPGDGDSNVALAVFSTLMLALHDQRRTGRGQFVSTSMIGGNAWAYADDFNLYDGKPALPRPDPDNYGFHALYRLYPARSGWVFLAAPRQTEWEALAATLGRSDLLGDPRFATPHVRANHDDALAALLKDTLATRDAGDWEQFLTLKGIACVQAFEAGHSEFTCTDPVMRETGLVVEVDHPLFGPILRHGLPATFSETPGRVAPGSLIGQHTDHILAELGYTEERIAKLRQDRIAFGGTH
jgi:crotonobetainyl-CoA:carnitine CoA-transferase CaiB-like acyl-CoA transferase